MERLNLYPEMDKEIVNILRLSNDNHANLYAAALIEEQAAKLAVYEALGTVDELAAIRAQLAEVTEERDLAYRAIQRNTESLREISAAIQATRISAHTKRPWWR